MGQIGPNKKNKDLFLKQFSTGLSSLDGFVSKIAYLVFDKKG